MNVNPGALNKRIEIVLDRSSNSEEAVDAEGYLILKDTLVHTCFAQFSRTSGTEVMKNNADFTTVKCRFLIRHTKKEINRKMYVRYAGCKYPIEYVNDYGDQRKYIELWCKQSTQEAVI